MNILRLRPFNSPLVLGMLRRMDGEHDLEISENSVFFVGCASTDSDEGISKFLEFAKCENLDELINFHQLSDNYAYAVLVRDARMPTNYHLFVINASEGVTGSQSFMFGKKLANEYKIEADEAKKPSVDIKAIVKDSFRDMVTPKFLKRK